MNATIAKIVNLLFEDLVETEETIALREEILQNCQERYQDLREAGISEDDAIHAVIESLSGMEEMLSEYPRKADEPDAAPESPKAELEEAEDEEEVRAWSCDPAESPIREIRMEHMGGADVTVCASQDELVHVECSDPELTLMTGMEDGVLTIALSEQKPDEISFSLQEGFDLSSIGKLFEKLALNFKNTLSDAKITLEIPAVLCPKLKITTSRGEVSADQLKLESLDIITASGDVEITSISCHSMDVTTASGDQRLDHLRVEENVLLASASGDMEMDNVHADKLEIHTASGDVIAHGCSISSSASVKTTSGDIEWMSHCADLQAVSVSGDLHLASAFQNAQFSTISGDVQLIAEGNSLQSVKGSTTSGDCHVQLPADIEAAISCRSRCGDIRIKCASFPQSPVTVELSSVSGDISVR